MFGRPGFPRGFLCRGGLFCGRGFATSGSECSFQKGLEKLLFGGLHDAGEVIRSLGDHRLEALEPFERGRSRMVLAEFPDEGEGGGEVRDGAIAIEGGLEVAGGAIRFGGLGEVAETLVTDGLLPRLGRREPGEDFERLAVMPGFEEEFQGAGPEPGRAGFGVRQSEGVIEGGRMRVRIAALSPKLMACSRTASQVCTLGPISTRIQGSRSGRYRGKV